MGLVITWPQVKIWSSLDHWFSFYGTLRLADSWNFQVPARFGGRRGRVRARAREVMVDFNGGGYYLAPSEDLVKFGPLSHFLWGFKVGRPMIFPSSGSLRGAPWARARASSRADGGFQWGWLLPGLQ